MHGSNASDTQEKLYKMLEKLQSMAREIPTKYQQRLPYDMLSSLAHLLLDNTVFEIVRELVELQYMTEKGLHQQRMHLLNRHRVERESLLKQQREEVFAAERQGKAHVAARLPHLHKERLKELETRHSKDISDCHERILQLLDEKVVEQQSTLQQVGVPGFHETDNPIELKIQMYILEFIVKLGGIKVPP